MCSGPVSTITELGPITGATGESPAPDGATSGGAVKTALTASGSLRSTSFIPLGENVSVNASPSLRAQPSITHVGAIAQASVCRNAGALGPGGRQSRPAPVGAGADAALAVAAVGALAIPTSYSPPAGESARGRRRRRPRRRRR